MVKYHISTSNKVVVCKAKKQQCPRKHFTTRTSAQVYVNNESTPPMIAFRDELINLAAEYGINPNEVKDHSGQSITEAWEKYTTGNGYNPDVLIEETFIADVLGDINMDGVRLRGTDIVFGQDDYPYFNPANNEDLIIARPDNVEENLKAVNPAYIEIYTRNGGGNRECFCDFEGTDSHDSGCHAQANERLENHPLYVTDADDEGDQTYASFYFRIPAHKLDMLKPVLENDLAYRRSKSANDFRKKLINKELPLYQILKPNPDKEKTISELREKQGKLVESKKQLAQQTAKDLRDSGFRARNWTYNNSLNDSHVQAVATIADAYERKAPYTEIKGIFSEFTVTAAEDYRNAIKAQQFIGKTQEVVKVYEDAITKLEKDSPALAEALKSTTSPKYSLTSVAYRNAEQTATYYKNKLDRVTKQTEKYSTLMNKIKDTDRTIKTLQDTVSWPGSLKTVPTLEESLD